MWSIYLIFMFVLYETVHVATVCASLMSFWAVKDINVVLATNDAIYLLIIFVYYIQSSWNHLALINHTLKKVIIMQWNSIQIRIKVLNIYIQILFSQIEITDFQPKFLHLYANTFCVWFFMLLYGCTINIHFYCVSERAGPLLGPRASPWDCVTYMGYLQLFIMLISLPCVFGKMLMIFLRYLKPLNLYLTIVFDNIADRNDFLSTCTKKVFAV